MLPGNVADLTWKSGWSAGCGLLGKGRWTRHSHDFESLFPILRAMPGDEFSARTGERFQAMPDAQYRVLRNG